MSTIIKFLGILFIGMWIAIAYKFLKGVVVCLLWLASAILQILLVVGFLLLVAYMAHKGWIIT